MTHPIQHEKFIKMSFAFRLYLTALFLEIITDKILIGPLEKTLKKFPHFLLEMGKVLPWSIMNHFRHFYGKCAIKSHKRISGLWRSNSRKLLQSTFKNSINFWHFTGCLKSNLKLGKIENKDNWFVAVLSKSLHFYDQHFHQFYKWIQSIFMSHRVTEIVLNVILLGKSVPCLCAGGKSKKDFAPLGLQIHMFGWMANTLWFLRQVSWQWT